MYTSTETQEIFKALAKFREVLKQPLRDANNPFFKSKYVPLENVVDVIDEAMKGTGLSYTQEATSQDNKISVATYIFHESGQCIKFDPLTLPATKADAQGLGSAVTYAKRYALTAVFGIASDPDDDGNGASNLDKSKSKSNAKASNKPTNTAPKTLTAAQRQTAQDKLQTFADQQKITIDEAVNKLFPFLKINTSFSQLTPEGFGVLMNYLNSH